MTRGDGHVGIEIFGDGPRIEAFEDLDRVGRFALQESGQAANVQARPKTPVSSSMPVGEPVLMQTRKLPMQDGEVAHDRVLLHPGEYLPLYLPPGEYELQSHRGDGEVVGRMRMVVE